MAFLADESASCRTQLPLQIGGEYYFHVTNKCYCHLQAIEFTQIHGPKVKVDKLGDEKGETEVKHIYSPLGVATGKLGGLN